MARHRVFFFRFPRASLSRATKPTRRRLIRRRVRRFEKPVFVYSPTECRTAATIMCVNLARLPTNTRQKRNDEKRRIIIVVLYTYVRRVYILLDTNWWINTKKEMYAKNYKYGTLFRKITSVRPRLLISTVVIKIRERRSNIRKWRVQIRPIYPMVAVLYKRFNCSSAHADMVTYTRPTQRKACGNTLFVRRRVKYTASTVKTVQDGRPARNGKHVFAYERDASYIGSMWRTVYGSRNRICIGVVRLKRVMYTFVCIYTYKQ